MSGGLALLTPVEENDRNGQLLRDTLARGSRKSQREERPPGIESPQGSGRDNISARVVTPCGIDAIVLGRFKTAMVPFKQMIRDHPDSRLIDRAVYNLAVCNSRLGKNREALRLLDLFVRSFPRSSWIDKARKLQAAIQKRVSRGA